MSAAISFVVPGNPIPTARPRVVRTKAGTPMAFTPKPSRDYQATVKDHARRVMRGPPIAEPVRLSVTFFRDSERRCDLDNLLKSVLDGLTLAKLWLDDSQVIEIRASKALSRREPRAEVTVERIGAQASLEDGLAKAVGA